MREDAVRLSCETRETGGKGETRRMRESATEMLMSSSRGNVGIMAQDIESGSYNPKEVLRKKPHKPS